MPHPPASHADHDPLAIAAYAAGDATGAELDDALALVAACADCAALHHDLRAIAAALPALPEPVRPRDFRLTPEQAASLRPAGWRRLLAPLAGPRFAFAGPLGTGLATLGIAGLLVAGSVGMPLGGAALAPADGGGSPAAVMAAPAAESPSPEAAPVEVPAGQVTGGYPSAVPGPSAASVDEGPWLLAPGSSPDPKEEALPGDTRASVIPEDEAFVQAAQAPVHAPPAVSPVAGLAAILLLAGMLLGGLRLVARRLG